MDWSELAFLLVLVIILLIDLCIQRYYKYNKKIGYEHEDDYEDENTFRLNAFIGWWNLGANVRALEN